MPPQQDVMSSMLEHMHRSQGTLNHDSFRSNDDSLRDEMARSIKELVEASQHGGGGMNDTSEASLMNSNTNKKDFTEVATEEQEKIAKNESKYVARTRNTVLVILGLAGLAMAGIVYSMSKGSEVEAFQDHWTAYTTAMEHNANERATNLLHNLQTFATSVTSMALATNAEWPEMTMPDFATRAHQLSQVTHADVVGLAPVVGGGDARVQWEAFANSGSIWGVVEVDGKKTTQVAPDKQIYLPTWQVEPGSQTLVNWDVMSNQDIAQLVTGMVRSKGPVVSGTTAPDLEITLVLNHDDDPSSSGVFHPHFLVVQPVFERVVDETTTANATTDTPNNNNNVMVGVVFVTIPWESMFTDVLPEQAVGMVVVVHDTCAKENDTQDVTYEINAATPTFLGPGDYHDVHYNEWLVNVTAVQPLTRAPASCEYQFHMYPSREMEQEFHTDLPIIYAGVTMFVFLMTGMAFMIYNQFVERRQMMVIATAAKSNAIVTSIFPKHVRDKLMEEAEEQLAAARQGKRSTGNVLPTTGKSQLKSFLKDIEQKEGNELRAFDSKPIADLFPSCTVLFADIAGFTAWSSTREPCQVFQLLETLYNAFDEIAKRRKVFKVETIGDCYVAVCGLPEPRRDHAVVMTRFSRDLLTAANDLTTRLEGLLGPDTSDLSMRVGLHSGPVTAGVLRGDNCRFQLFGDTVNTASRIESNGEANKIHISHTTAEHLRNFGKTNWLRERPDKIFAKGKGELQTYWLEMRGHSSAPSHRSTEDSACSGESNSEGNEHQGVKGLPESMRHLEIAIDGATAHQNLPPKLKRLVHFNADVLVRLLKQMIARRKAASAEQQVAAENDPVGMELPKRANGKTVFDEVVNVVSLPDFDADAVLNQEDPNTIQLPQKVVSQLYDYVTVLATMYRDVPFHNFEHASHVTMSVMKLLARIVAPDEVLNDEANSDEVIKHLHDHTYGITSDPMTQFAVVLSALIHDVDHTGVPNATLVAEGADIAKLYKNKSVAEQNSVDIAWDLLMDHNFKDLRDVIYTTETERKRFRQLVVNTVMATDICDKELKDLRNKRWNKAFKIQEDDSSQPSLGFEESEKESVDRKATIVIEHLIQASDISHTMQHWQIYKKWNERFFHENMRAYQAGRAEKNPAEYWYKGEIGFFDFYIIPLAKKLKECGVFGVSCDEYLDYAQNNRAEWVQQGEHVVAEFAAKYKPSLKEEDDEDDSSECSFDSEDGEDALSMTQDTLYNVGSSWDFLRKMPNYQEEAGLILFKRLFDKYPALKSSFGVPTDMAHSVEELKENPRILSHAKHFMETVDQIIELLSLDTELLSDLLHELGRKHVRFNVKEAFMPIMGDAFMETLSELLLLKGHFKPEVEHSWKLVYSAISSEMVKAMCTEKAVMGSWKKLKQIENYRVVAGETLFHRLFQLCPETKRFFGFSKDAVIDKKAIESNARFASVVANFIDMFDTALSMVEKHQIEENINRLGEMHANLGITEEHFLHMGEAIFHTLRVMLKKKGWSPTIEEAWRAVYSKLASQMIDAVDATSNANLSGADLEDLSEKLLDLSEKEHPPSEIKSGRDDAATAATESGTASLHSNDDKGKEEDDMERAQDVRSDAKETKAEEGGEENAKGAADGSGDQAVAGLVGSSGADGPLGVIASFRRSWYVPQPPGQSENDE